MDADLSLRFSMWSCVFIVVTIYQQSTKAVHRKIQGVKLRQKQGTDIWPTGKRPDTDAGNIWNTASAAVNALLQHANLVKTDQTTRKASELHDLLTVLGSFPWFFLFISSLKSPAGFTQQQHNYIEKAQIKAVCMQTDCLFSLPPSLNSADL